MTLPVPEKTWQFNVNQTAYTSGAQATDNASLLYAIKASLIGFGTAPWTVSGSSNGAGAGAMDGVDRWASAANVIWNTTGNNHSWIVLKQTGIDVGFEVLIDCNVAQQYYLTVTWATSGFAGGSATTAPTAAGSITSISAPGSNMWAYGSTSAFSRILHVMQSTDGECTRIVVWCNSGLLNYAPYTLWMFEKVKNPVSSWTKPFFVLVPVGSSTAKATYAFLNDVNRGVAVIGSTYMYLYFSGEGMVSSLVPEVLAQRRRNQINNQLWLGPIHLVCDMAGRRGLHGSIYDLWWGHWDSHLVGGWDGTFPDDSTRQFWNCINLIFPWVGLNTPPGPVPLVVSNL
jgi:hypothetical protein